MLSAPERRREAEAWRLERSRRTTRNYYRSLGAGPRVTPSGRARSEPRASAREESRVHGCGSESGGVSAFQERSGGTTGCILLRVARAESLVSEAPCSGVIECNAVFSLCSHVSFFFSLELMPYVLQRYLMLARSLSDPVRFLPVKELSCVSLFGVQGWNCWVGDRQER